MTLKASLVAKVVTELESGKLIIGTAYPIRQGVVITAYHLIPNIEQPQKTNIKWLENNLSSPVKKILFQDKENDVVLLKCKTPDKIPVIDFNQNSPKSTEHWDSFGFPDAGINHVLNVRDKTPAGGHYFIQSDESCEMHLQVSSDAAETNLWRGMSGAPVFTVGTNRLTGIISQVPDNENSEFRNRIYATSIARLLVTNAEFRPAIVINTSYSKHVEKHRLALLDELTELKKNNEDFYKSLITNFEAKPRITPDTLCNTIVDSYANEPINSVKNLRLACEPFMGELREQCELFLLYLLATKAPVDTWDCDSFHDLAVRTRILVELKLSARYQATPRFTRVDEYEIAGLGAIHDHSCKEVGFDALENAKQQAKSIAYYIYKQTDDGYDIEQMDDKHWGAVDETISTRRLGEQAELIRFEVDSEEEFDHPLASEDVRRYLYDLLPSLPVVVYGSNNEADEEMLRSQVREFYRRMENAQKNRINK